MKENDPQDSLEKFIDDALKDLPSFKAPPRLVDRVMQRVELSQTVPWWQRGWSSWPFALRVPSVLALGSLAVLFVRGLAQLWTTLVASQLLLRIGQLAGGAFDLCRGAHLTGPLRVYLWLSVAGLATLCLIAPMVVGAIRLVWSFTLERR